MSPSVATGTRSMCIMPRCSVCVSLVITGVIDILVQRMQHHVMQVGQLRRDHKRLRVQYTAKLRATDAGCVPVSERCDKD